MKNLMNRVLVVLTVSVLCAGTNKAVPRNRSKSVPSSVQSKEPGTSPVETPKLPKTPEEALKLLRIKSRLDLNADACNKEARKVSIKILNDGVTSAKDTIQILKKETLATDDKKRAKSFTEGGAGFEACATIEALLLNDKLTNANEKLEAALKTKDPTQVLVATKEVAERRTEAEIVITASEKHNKSKIFKSARAKVAAAIGISTLVVGGLLTIYGAPEWLKPFIPDMITTMSNATYSTVSAVGKSLGFHRGGRAYGIVNYLLPVAITAALTAASTAATEKLAEKEEKEEEEEEEEEKLAAETKK
jgi:hypothetical protein